MIAMVLGSSGFVGRALVRELESRGQQVIGHSSTSLDLRARDAVHRLASSMEDASTTALYMVSALTPDRAIGLQGLADNLAMVMNVGRFLEASRLRKCVYFSSDAVYPMCAEPLDESAPVHAGDLYALSKLNGERILDHATRANDVALVILRLTGVYGPSDPHDAYGPNRFARAIAEGQPVQLFGDGEELRDHIYVEDVARIAAELGERETHGVFNVATGVSRTFASIVEDFRVVSAGSFAVEHRPRGGPITHRSFRIDRLRHAVPDLNFTPFVDSLALMLAAARDKQYATVG